MKLLAPSEREKLRRVWYTMKQRCFNPDNHKWPDYGGRGITVCERWLEFENFVEDMGPRPDGLQIDRINNNGNYHPDNCHWATPLEQANNKRNNLVINWQDETLTLKQWAKKLDLPYKVLWQRFCQMEWTVEETFTTPIEIGQKRPGYQVYNQQPVTFNGETLVLREWAQKTGISESTLRRRLNRDGWEIEKALTTPAGKWTDRAGRYSK